ncbi:methyltransferase [Pseudomonas chlororaphis subsp. piscium]|uniref:methyltransferase n=1 Tax=Pseudomonas chlororaphis TaxID=587753 RepID=UPI000F55F008|nr:methyltransferase [Pseudomonas chlororaphis]AZD86826.1 Plasmid related protein [Pseudomonas chlororaphis subsp. aureofaciens]UQS88700.1 methyltransferase [Pseudomonas chlororaphis subsp. piscium]
MFRLTRSSSPKPQPIPVFSFGTLHLSEKVLWLASNGLIDPLIYLHRHLRGDWGDVDGDTRLANNASLGAIGQLTSRYVVNPRLTLHITSIEKSFLTTIHLQGESPVQNG